MNVIIISIIAVATSFLLMFLLEKFGKRARAREIQEKMNKVNKQYSEAQKAHDAPRIAELEKEIAEFPKLMGESMMLSMRSIVISLPIVFVLPWLIRSVFPVFSIQLPFSLPVPSSKSLIEWRDTFGAYGWFYISFLFFGGVAQLLWASIKKMKKGDVA